MVTQSQNEQRTDFEKHILEQERHLARMVEQKDEELALRQAEYIKNQELGRLTMLNTQATDNLAREEATKNELLREQNEIIKGLTREVAEFLLTVRERNYDKKLDLLHEAMDKITKQVETMVFVLLGLRPYTELDPDNARAAYIGKRKYTAGSTNRTFEELTTNLLMECGTIRDNFGAVMNDITIPEISSIKNLGNLKVAVRQVVKACIATDGFRDLLDAIVFYEQNSIAVLALAEHLRSNGRI